MAQKTQIRPKRSWRRTRVFASTFVLTLCLLMMGAGFLVAGYNTRKMAFGEEELPLRYVEEGDRIVLRAAHREEPLELPGTTEPWAGRLWALLPARLRMILWMEEAECDLAPVLLEQLDSRK